MISRRLNLCRTKSSFDYLDKGDLLIGTKNCFLFIPSTRHSRSQSSLADLYRLDTEYKNTPMYFYFYFYYFPSLVVRNINQCPSRSD